MWSIPPLKRNWQWLNRVVFGGLVCLVSIMIFLPCWFKTGLFQEPPLVMLTALSLELRDADAIALDPAGERWVLETNGGVIPGWNDAMKPWGWRHATQEGASHLVVSKHSQLMFTCVMYSTHYMICEQ